MAGQDIVSVLIKADADGAIGKIAKLTATVGASVYAIKKATDSMADWSRYAADAEETASKFFTVFRNLTPQASRAVKTLASSFDLADSTVQKMLGDSGDLLTGFGFTQEAALDLSTEMNALAIDLASFTNFSGGAAGASQALSALMLGETERAKALGIVVRQDSDEYKNLVTNLMETQGVTLLQAKAMAGLQIATEQSKNAIGDYSRTSGSFTNSSKRMKESSKELKEQLGFLVNEGMSPLVSYAATAAKALANIVKQQRLTTVMDEMNELQGRIKALQKGSIGVSSSGGIKGFSREDLKPTDEAVKGLTERFDQLSAKYKEIEGSAPSIDFKPPEIAPIRQTDYIEEEKTIQEKMAALKLAEYESNVKYQDQITENLISQGEERRNALAEEAAFEAELFEARLNAASTFFNGWAALAQMGAEKSSALAIAFKVLASAEAGINSYLAYTKVLASAPWPWNIAAASGVLAKGIAAQAKIYSTDVPKFASGGDFVTSGPQMIMVGDNATGRERVTVNPIGNDSGSGEQVLIVPLIIDGNEIGRVMTRLSADGRMITSSRSVR